MLRSMNALGLKNTRSRRAKMRNLRIAHIAATLYGSYELRTRESTRSRHAEAMNSVRRAFDAARRRAGRMDTRANKEPPMTEQTQNITQSQPAPERPTQDQTESI